MKLRFICLETNESFDELKSRRAMSPKSSSNRGTQIVLSGQQELLEFSKFVHLNYESFSEAEVSRGQDPKRQFLSLGETISEWHSATLDLSLQLYSEVKKSVRKSLLYMGRELSDREFQILYGHLLKAVCSRVSRTALQLENLPRFSTFAIVDELKVSKHDSYPRTSSEAYEYLASSLVSSRIEGELARILLNLHTSSIEETPMITASPRMKLNLFQGIYLALARVQRGATKKSRFFISSTYLGRWREALLQLSLLQLPLFNEIRSIDKTSSHEFTSRTHGLGGSSPKTIQEFTIQLFWSLIPTSLLENATGALMRCQKQGWPERPSVIFTSNNFDTDDMFKVYLVHHLQRVEYVVGQHGNGYGVSRLDEHNAEVLTPDLFLSWGWKGKAVIPVGVFTPRLRSSSKKSKGAFLVLRDPDRFSFTHDESWTTMHYLSRISDLVRELGHFEMPIIIKLHSTSSSRMIQWAQGLSESIPNVQLAGRRTFRQLLRSGFLPVFTYDSTGMLELGTSGASFFFFAAEGTHHVRPEFVPNYLALESSGLLSREPSEAAHLIDRLASRSVTVEEMAATVKEFLDGIAMRRSGLIIFLRRILLASCDVKSSL